MPPKPAKKKESRVQAGPSKKPPLIPTAPETFEQKNTESNFPQASSMSTGTRIRIAAVLAAVGIYFFVHHHFSASAGEAAAPAPAAAAAQPTIQPIPPSWGNELKLEKISSFAVRPDTTDFWVNSKGNAIVLAGDGLEYYVAGELSRTAAIGMGPNQALACNGSSIFVTDSDNNYVSHYNMSFARVGGFAVRGATRLLGMTWSAENDALFISDVAGQILYKISADGTILGKKRIDKTAYSAQGFAYDVAEAGRRLIVTDIYNGCIRLVDPSGKGEVTLQGLCPSEYNRRIALVHGKLYVPCEQSGAIMVVDEHGGNEGYLDINSPIVRAGHDGFLYIFVGDEIRKYRAL